MNREEKKSKDNLDHKPKTARKNFKSNAPESPETPQAPSEKNIQDESEMPDLDKFHFMNW